MIEYAGDAFHNREPEPKSARDLGALIEPMKLAEDLALLRRRYPTPVS